MISRGEINAHRIGGSLWVKQAVVVRMVVDWEQWGGKNEKA
jgi:hypothetical protein